MLHQLVAIGDIHAQSTNPRNVHRLGALDQIIGIGSELPRLAAWLILGDVFHGRSSVDDRNALDLRLQRMAWQAPVLICYGNHELPGDLDGFERLRAQWPIRVVSTPGVHRIRLASEATAAIFVLPYPSRGGLVAAGSTAGQTLQAGHQALEDIFRGAAASLARETAQGEIPLMIGHLNVAGAVASNGQPQIGREIEADRALLAMLGPCPKILGHIHQPQEFAHEQAWYCGSIARLDWGETEEKRFLVVEFSAADEFVGSAHAVGPWDYDVVSHPIHVAPMFRVEGELTREGFRFELPEGAPRGVCSACDGTGDGIRDPVEGALFCERCKGSGLGPAIDWSRCEVRVRYRFAASERNLLDHAAVRAPFADAARLEVEPVAVPDRALRAPEVAAARTLRDKVLAWAPLAGLSVTEGVIAKLGALEHSDPTQALSQVANQVAALETPAAREECAA